MARRPFLRRAVSAAALLLLLATAAPADDALLGKWTFTEDGETSTIEFRAGNQVDMDGELARYRVQGDKIFLESGGMQVPMTYRIEGNTLTIDMFGEVMRYTRIASPSKPVPMASPVPARPSGNPLARKPEAAPAAVGSWQGEGILLELSQDGPALKGRLVMEGQAYPVRAQAGPPGIRGTLSLGAEEYPFEATVSGSELRLVSEGASYRLQRLGGIAGGSPGQGADPGAVGGTASSAPEGEWFRMPDNGVEVQLAQGYRMLKPYQGGYVIGSDTLPGMVLVFPSATVSQEEIDRAATQGLMEGTVQVAPSGAPREVSPEGGGRGVVVPIEGTMEGSPVKGLLAGYRGGAGNGVAILAVTSPESWPRMQAAAELMSTRVRFTKPEVSPRLANARAELAGKSLVWAYNSNQVAQNADGYYVGSAVNTFEAWHCCANGRGRYEGARSMSYQGGGIFGSSESGPGAWDGSWSLDAQGEDFRLTFRFDDGSSQGWTVSVDAAGEVYVEGRKVQVKTDSICQ
jgi:hypothetical protein